MIKDYDDSNWRSEYIDIKGRQLTKRQVELLEKGPDSLSSSWILGAMHNEWKLSLIHISEPTRPY